MDTCRPRHGRTTTATPRELVLPGGVGFGDEDGHSGHPGTRDVVLDRAALQLPRRRLSPWLPRDALALAAPPLAPARSPASSKVAFFEPPSPGATRDRAARALPCARTDGAAQFHTARTMDALRPVNLEHGVDRGATLSAPSIWQSSSKLVSCRLHARDHRESFSRRRRFQADEAVSPGPRLRNSFRVAAVMEPSVPSAPINSLAIVAGVVLSHFDNRFRIRPSASTTSRPSAISRATP